MSRARGPILSDAWLVALAPARTFDALAGRDPRGSMARTAGVVAFGLAVLAAALTALATRVAALPTLASVALCWSFVPLIQCAAAAAACRGASRARVSRVRGVELIFTAHLPWSLWMLGVALSGLWLDPGPGRLGGLLVAAVVPTVWTPVLLAAFCRTVLMCSAAEARRRTALHQTITWGAIVLFLVATIQPWARY